MDVSLRERKKLQTRSVLWNRAIELFVEHGFDNVSVAQIAAAAEVSKMTVFNYFPTKEDLVVGPMTEHIDEPARVVAQRAPGESPVAAIRRHFLDALAQRDANTGLNDAPNVLAVRRLVLETPSLLHRAYGLMAQTEELLAAALADGPEVDLHSRIVASMLLGARNTVVAEITRRLLAGETADEVYPSAVLAANEAFDLLEHGLGA